MTTSLPDRLGLLCEVFEAFALDGDAMLRMNAAVGGPYIELLHYDWPDGLDVDERLAEIPRRRELVVASDRRCFTIHHRDDPITSGVRQRG